MVTSEGISRNEIGRHRWADLRPMWNMDREGFKQLYDQLPGDKPPSIRYGELHEVAPSYWQDSIRWAGMLKEMISQKKVDVFIASLDAREIR